ncbi:MULTISPECIES: hypothetical protein [unclassified Pseudomonas]|uniref:hypothetical protein n=1 Tax=unclassified Pseudomonas TaxID=196821 RepID=UPI000A1F2841|nr:MULTISPECIES: hypothetical protein [unclassified Pseudomonas]
MERQWLQVALAKSQLLSVQADRALYTQAVSGTHWISADGVDYLIGPGEQLKLSAGLALIDGEGLLQLRSAGRRIHGRPWRSRLLKINVY